MAETTVAPNNKSVTFRSKPEREMPMPPKTMNAEGAPVEGARKPKKGKKLAPGVRKSAKRAINRGMISQKAAKRHLGEY